jgi:hypothetical protein
MKGTVTCSLMVVGMVFSFLVLGVCTRGELLDRTPAVVENWYACNQIAFASMPFLWACPCLMVVAVHGVFTLKVGVDTKECRWVRST